MESKSLGKFACIGHPLDVEQFKGFVNKLRSTYQYPEKQFKDKLLIKLFEWTPAFKVKDLEAVGFSGAPTVDGIVVMAPFLPEMKDIKLKEVGDKIEDAIAIAAQNGCSVAALGAFTSIILQGREEDLCRKHGIKLTSGNTFTAAIVVRSVERIASLLGVNLAESTVTIIGASGDIGSGCTGYFCDKVKKLVLTARGMDKLEETRDRYKTTTRCEVALLSDKDNKEAVRQADIAIFATSATKEIVSLSDFAPATIVCDASAPLNVKVNGNLRPDVFVYHGGIVSLPFDIDVGFDLGLAPSTFFGCQIEGVLISMFPNLPCSWGRGNITPDKLSLYLSVLEQASGMEVVFSHGHHIYSDNEILAYKSRWRDLTCAPN